MSAARHNAATCAACQRLRRRSGELTGGQRAAAGLAAAVTALLAWLVGASGLVGLLAATAVGAAVAIGMGARRTAAAWQAEHDADEAAAS